MKLRIASALAVTLMCVPAMAQWQTVWEAGTETPGGWIDNGSGIQFVQEAAENEPPGNPDSPAINQQADDDFYFAGTYPDPIGTVDQELAIERAFAGTDNALRIHFNVDSVNAGDKFRFTTRPFNLHEVGADTRYGVRVDVNGTEVMPEYIVTTADLNTLLTSPEFTAGDVGLVAGPGADNVLTLTGINYDASGGGNWMGMDYHHLETMAVPEPGSLAMLLTGMFWGIPMMWQEAIASKKNRK